MGDLRGNHDYDDDDDGDDDDDDYDDAKAPPFRIAHWTAQQPVAKDNILVLSSLNNIFPPSF